jgi:hypothetical protein
MSSSPLNVIREYLVQLGYHVDVPSQDAARQSVEGMGKVIGKFADGAVAKFAMAGAGVAGFVTATTAVIADLTLGVANANLQNELFARQMWMNTDATLAYRNSLSALGTDIQSLYLSPELMDRFNSLRDQAGAMGTPADFSQTMRSVRDVTFELQRLKLEGSYAVQWVGYALAKDLMGPAGDLRGMLAKLNDYLTKNMPVWTKSTADFLAGFVQLGKAAVWAGQGVIDIWNGAGTATKEFLTLVGGAGVAIAVLSNPVTAMLASMAALLLLIDDYAGFKSGKNSALPSLWKEFDAFQDKAKAMNPLAGIETSLTNLQTMAGKFKESEGLKSLQVGANALWLSLKDAAGSMKDLLDNLNKLNSDVTGSNPVDILVEKFTGFLRVIGGGTQGLGALVGIVNALAHGDLQGALGQYKQFGVAEINIWKALIEPPAALKKQLEQKGQVLGTPPPGSSGGMMPSHSMGTPSPLSGPFNFGPQPQSYNPAPLIGRPQSYASASITVSPVYHITGTNAEAIATAVNYNNQNLLSSAGLLLRRQQGVIA